MRHMQCLGFIAYRLATGFCPMPWLAPDWPALGLPRLASIGFAKDLYWLGGLAPETVVGSFGCVGCAGRVSIRACDGMHAHGKKWGAQGCVSTRGLAQEQKRNCSVL